MGFSLPPAKAGNRGSSEVSGAFPFCLPKDASAPSKHRANPGKEHPEQKPFPRHLLPPSRRPDTFSACLTVPNAQSPPAPARGWPFAPGFAGSHQSWQFPLLTALERGRSCGKGLAAPSTTRCPFGGARAASVGRNHGGFPTRSHQMPWHAARSPAHLAAEQRASPAALTAPLGPSTAPLLVPAGHGWSPNNYGSFRKIPSSPRRGWKGLLS